MKKSAHKTLKFYIIVYLFLLVIHCYTPPHKKWPGIVIPSENFECPSIHPRFVSGL